MLTVIIVSIIIVMLAFASFSVRLIFKKNSEFRGACANNNPFMQKEGIVCGVYGRKSGEICGEEAKN